MRDEIIEEFYAANELRKNDDDYVVNDDTQVGIEFAFDKISEKKCQIISEDAITFLFNNYPEVYKEFYSRVNGGQPE